MAFQNPAVMTPSDDRASDPWNTSYLLDWLIGNTSMPLMEAGALGAREAAVLQLAREMVLEFAALYPTFMLFERYYCGDPPLAAEPVRLTRKYRELLVMGVSNWLGLVVDVVDERLQVSSIGSSTNATRDETAWKWWQRNKMDGISQRVHTTALKYGVAYVSVWPGETPELPKIMGESPLVCHVRFDDDDNAVAAIRIWKEACCPDIFVDLTMADYQFHLVADMTTVTPIVRENYYGPMGTFGGLDFTGATWKFRVDVDPVTANPIGVVPYARLRTMPDLLGGYRSEMEGLLPIADRINKTIFDRLLAQEFAAFPQRWVTGIDVPTDPDTNQPREPFNAAVDRIWTSSSPDTKMGQFATADLQPYLNAVTSDVQALATQSRTPPHYLVAGMGQFPSGESVRATEYGLTRKCQARQQSYGDGWQQVLHLCALVAGDQTLADDEELNVVWKDVEARSEGELVDALLKMGSLNVPPQALWQRWGASPSEIEQWTALMQQQAAALAQQRDAKVAILPSLDVAQQGVATRDLGNVGRDDLAVNPGGTSVDTNRVQV
jgi:hypothetical protein